MNLSYNEFSLMREVVLSQDVRTPADNKCCVFFKRSLTLPLKQQFEWQEVMRRLHKKGPLVCGYYCAIGYKETLYHPL